ncbi:MAG: hypothetical protein ACJ8OJ_15580 [Povalibacter sp.]|jgi:hypothetical protein
MTAEHRPSISDSVPEEDDATVKMPKLPGTESNTEEEFDPDSTLVREDWESTVIRRIAPHVAAVQSQVGENAGDENRFGWETECLRRLAHEVQKAGA